MKFLPLLSLLVFMSCSGSEKGKSPTSRSESSPVISEVRQVRVPSNVINNTDSKVSHDPRDPFRVFVAPPKKAQIRISTPEMFNSHEENCDQAYLYPDAVKSWEKDRILVNELKVRIYEIDQTREDLLIKIEEIADDSKRKMLEDKVRALADEIQSLESELSVRELDLKNSGNWMSYLFKILFKNDAIADVEWISNWDENLEKLRLDNPQYQFDFDTTFKDVKVSMIAEGLEGLPAVQMVPTLEPILNLKLVNLQLVVGTIPTKLKKQLVITGFASCPMKRPEDFDYSRKEEIIINMEFQM